MASLILKRFYCQSFSDILKIRNISSFYSVSCGPLNHLRSRLSNEFTFVTQSSCSCLLRSFNFEGEQSAPKLPPLYLTLRIATTSATCAEDEDLSFSGNKETVSNQPLIAIVKPFDFARSNLHSTHFGRMHDIISFLFRTLKTTSHCFASRV